MNRRQIAVTLAVVTASYIVAPPPAAAYIDPLSGSIVFQVLAASFMAAYLSFRRFRDYLSGSIRNIMSRLRK